MQIAGNTILITGGNGGIGRALAEALHAAGNRVIIAGRNQATLDEVTAAHPDISAYPVDMTDAASIGALAERVIREHPGLDAVIHNAGIMQPEKLVENAFLPTAELTVATNLLGPMRLTSALLPQLMSRPRAAILTISSGLAFVPMVATPSYSATKAAIHAWSMCIREQLRGTPVQVIEIAPPYVQTALMGDFQKSDPNAMPLAEFISEVVSLLTRQSDAEEIIVERCKPLRYAAENGQFQGIFTALNHLAG